MFPPGIARRLLPSSTSSTGREPDMIAAVIKFSVINFSLTFFVFGLVAAGVRILRTPRPRDRATVTGAMLNYFILFSIVVTYVYNFVVHSVFGGFSARVIGWAQSPFQLEVAFASLGFALIGLVAFPRRAGLRVKLAAVLGVTPFLWGAAGGHVYQILTTGNTSAGNAGVVLFMDILLPVFGLAVLALHHRALAAAADCGEQPSTVVGAEPVTVHG
jgi:hypothetical protein